MIEIITTIGTGIFYLLIVRKYMLIFFNGDNINKVNEKNISFLFIFITSTVYFIFQHPLANMLGNLLMTYTFAQLYKCQQKDKVLVSILIYCTGAFCDILSVYLFSNYIYGGEYDILAAYVAVLLLAICEFVTEHFLVKNKKSNLATPYWKVLIAIPTVSIILISILAVNNINNQTHSFYKWQPHCWVSYFKVLAKE